MALVCAAFACFHGAKARVKGDASAEDRYLLRVADSDHDGVVSESELARYRELQEEIERSHGELTLSEDGELVIADTFAHDEEASAEFEKRQHMKD